jgi:predicted dinucleotide-binding enzyme
MLIAIVGAGNVGTTLGTGWTRRGHQIVYGVRDPRDPTVARRLADTGAGARAASVSDASAEGEVVVLATPWSATREAIRTAGSLADKIVLDCTNPLKSDLTGLEVGHTSSGAELVASWAPGAKVVKVFNTTGSNNMANPRYGTDAATMFYCGDDAAAKAVAARLAADLGFDPVDAGPLANARLLEPLAMLWIHLAIAGRGREIAFKLMRRNGT